MFSVQLFNVCGSETVLRRIPIMHNGTCEIEDFFQDILRSCSIAATVHNVLDAGQNSKLHHGAIFICLCLTTF